MHFLELSYLCSNIARSK